MTLEEVTTLKEVIKRLKEVIKEVRSTIQPFLYDNEAKDYILKALEQESTVDAVPMSVIEEIKAEINYVGAHSDYGMQCVFAVAIAIIDKHIGKEGAV